MELASLGPQIPDLWLASSLSLLETKTSLDIVGAGGDKRLHSVGTYLWMKCQAETSQKLGAGGRGLCLPQFPDLCQEVGGRLSRPSLTCWSSL